MTVDTDLGKSWDFIKAHLHAHMFDDIQAKGALRGMNTKSSEQLHGPLRKIYLRQTNFKDVGSQVSC